MQLESYQVLANTLNPDLQEFVWTEQLYPILEKQILEEGLRFKTNFLSGAESIYLIVCSFTHLSKTIEGNWLEKLLQEAIFYSYLFQLGKCSSIYVASKDILLS